MINKFLPIKALYLIIAFTCVISCTSHNEQQIEQQKAKITVKNQTQVNWVANWLARESKKKLLVGAAREFEFLNQDIKINIKFQEELCNNCKNVTSAVQDTIVQMIRSGNYTWDIVTLTQGYYSSIASELKDPEWGKKYLVNFEDFDWFKKSHKSLIFENPQYRNDLGGIFAGPLIEGRYYSLWYNRNTAKKIGIQVKPLGMTFDDFKGYVKQAYEYNQTANEKIQIFDINFIPEITNTLILSALEQTDTLKVDLTKSLAALKRVLKALETLIIYNPIDTTIKFDNVSNPILEEKVLFGANVSSWYNQWETMNKTKAQNMLPAEAPVFEKPVMFFHGSYQSVWAVLKNAPHSKEAVKFMQYMCSNDIAEKWISSTKNPTGLNVRINASDLGEDEIGTFTRDIEKKYGKNMNNYNIAKVLFGPKCILKIDATQVVSGKITADEYYNQIVKQLKKQK